MNTQKQQKMSIAWLNVAVFGFFALSAFAGALTASAAETKDSAKSDKKAELMAEIQMRKQNLEAKKLDAKLEAAAKKARAQLEALVDRLDDIKEKIVSRIEKTEDDGIDASPARDALSTASSSIADARDAVKNATSTRRAFEAAESMVKKAQNALEDVVEVIKSLN